VEQRSSKLLLTLRTSILNPLFHSVTEFTLLRVLQRSYSNSVSAPPDVSLEDPVSDRSLVYSDV
jgi:hypothetical protein